MKKVTKTEMAKMLPFVSLILLSEYYYEDLILPEGWLAKFILLAVNLVIFFYVVPWAMKYQDRHQKENELSPKKIKKLILDIIIILAGSAAVFFLLTLYFK